MFRQLLSKFVSKKEELKLMIVGPSVIDGDVRAGVYSILDTSTMKQVVLESTNDTNKKQVSSIVWSIINPSGSSVELTEATNQSKMHVNILNNHTNNGTATIKAIVNGEETISFTLTATYSPADIIINNLNDWLNIKDAIDNSTESSLYTGSTTGFANKRLRLNSDLTFDYSITDYCIGRFNYSSRSGKYFGGVFDGGDYTITVSGTLYQNSSTDRPGSVFGLLRAARLLNLNIKGNISGHTGVGGFAGASQMKSSLERICCKVNVIASNGAGSGIGAMGNYRSGVSNENISSSYKDILYCGHVKASAHAAGLTYDTSRKIERCTVIGTMESLNTSNPVKSCSSLYDIIKTNNDELWARDLFQKANLIKGDGKLKGVIQVPLSTTIIGIDRVIDLNKTEQNPTLLASIFHQSSIANKYSDIFRTNSNQSSFTYDSWQHTNGVAKTFSDLCSEDVFNGNSNWIKGDVGVPIINNQYATDTDVLSAAKVESYYGPTIS